MIKREIKREDFGPGIFGQIAWEIVSSGTVCKECNSKLATHTNDVDVHGDLEQFPCCDDCDAAQLALLKRELGLIQIDNTATFSSNGRGRSAFVRGFIAKAGL